MGGGRGSFPPEMIPLNFENRRTFERNEILTRVTGPTAQDQIPGVRESDQAFEGKLDIYGGMDTFVYTMQDVGRVVAYAVGMGDYLSNATLASIQLTQAARMQEIGNAIPEGDHVVLVLRDVAGENSATAYSSLGKAIDENPFRVGEEGNTFRVMTREDLASQSQYPPDPSLKMDLLGPIFHDFSYLRSNFVGPASPACFDSPGCRPPSENTISDKHADGDEGELEDGVL